MLRKYDFTYQTAHTQAQATMNLAFHENIDLFKALSIKSFSILLEIPSLLKLSDSSYTVKIFGLFLRVTAFNKTEVVTKINNLN